MTLSRSRGVSEVVSYSVITGTVLTLVLTMMIAAPPIIEETQSEEEIDITQQQFKQLDSNLHDIVSTHQTELQESTLPPESIQHDDHTVITISDTDGESVSIETAPIVHQSAHDTTTIYDSGLLGSDHNSNRHYESISITPDWNTGSQPNTMHITKIKNTDNINTIGSMSQIRFNMTMAEHLQTHTLSAENDISIEIESNYPNLWKQYLAHLENIENVELVNGQSISATLEIETTDSIDIKEKTYQIQF